MDNGDKWTNECEELLAEWSEKASCYRWLHGRSEKKYKKQYYGFSIPVIILSTLTGAANVGMDSFVNAENKPLASAIVGGINIIAGIISTFQNFLKVITQPSKVNGQVVNAFTFNRSSNFRFHTYWCDVVCNIYRISNFIYSYFFRICFWLFGFWKISFLFNDTTIFYGDDGTNTRCRSALCIYGHNDGTSRINGKIIFSISIDVG